MIGKIALFPYEFEPSGWMFCDGRLVPISGNDVLFTLLGTAFGGDGESTFGLPDLSKLAPSNCHYCISVKGVFNDNYYEGIVGETMLSVAPPSAQNLKECMGQTVAKEQAPLLLLYMGAPFGGDGVKNFKLPDMRNHVPAGLRYLMAVQANDPNLSRNGYVGELFALPYEVQTETLLLCNGNRISTQTHAALYSLLGTRFGGDSEQFALPDLRASAPPRYSYYINTRGRFPSRG
ncbi:MAG TPA: tail fiber protein [Pyrinomonadaceae bacterium]|nr:tail fiber protein [Pyrinomonadaceae bacterium]